MCGRRWGRSRVLSYYLVIIGEFVEKRVETLENCSKTHHYRPQQTMEMTMETTGEVSSRRDLEEEQGVVVVRRRTGE